MTIAETLEKLKKKNEGALAMFATAGDPDRETSLELFKTMGDSGADLIEIGIPYSDPLMDGPVLQRSYQRALKAGFNLAGFPSFIEDIRAATPAPLLVMTCYNPVYKYGVRRFFRDISNAGVDAVLLTDLPPEEWGESLDLARGFRLGTVFLLAPTTPSRRMELINDLSDPFVYCVSKMGITGSEHDGAPDALKEYVSFVKGIVTKPLLVGFGISTPEQAEKVGGLADGVVVGSALVAIVERHLEDNRKIFEFAGKFVSDLKDAL